MKNIRSFPNNVDEFVGAKPLMRWFHGRTSGVWGAGKNAAVTAATGSTMQVTVSDGLGWLSDSDGDGVVWWIDYEKENGAPLILDVEPADTLRNRIDRVVVSWDTYDYAKLPSISIVKGNYDVSAQPPALVNDESMRQISLAQISVPAGAVKITPALITDERLDASVCGIVTENVAVDTSMMQAQFNAYLEQLRQDIEDVMVNVVPDGAISTRKLAFEAVTEEKVAPNAITENKVQDGAIKENKIFKGAVTASKIAKDAVTNEKLQSDSVTEEKIAKNSVSNSYTATISAGLWINKGSYFEATANVSGISPAYPFIIDLNLDSSTYGAVNDLEADFGLIFDAKCETPNELILRAKKKPLKSLPVKILKIKR